MVMCVGFYMPCKSMCKMYIVGFGTCYIKAFTQQQVQVFKPDFTKKIQSHLFSWT